MPTAPPDVDQLLGRVRDLTAGYKAGDHRSFEAFRELAGLLLGLTVLKRTGAVRLIAIHGVENRRVLAGWKGPDDPLPLNDSRYLRFSVTLELARTPDGDRLNVYESSYQYQPDRAGERWIFRYDYLRHPPSPHPGAHLQVRATLKEPHILRRGLLLERVHFPTSRVSLEAVIRLLAEEFDVPCNTPSEVWRPLLTESEGAFLEIAHRPQSGPER